MDRFTGGLMEYTGVPPRCRPTELVGGVSSTAAPRRRGGDFCMFDADSMIDAPASPTLPAGRAHRV